MAWILPHFPMASARDCAKARSVSFSRNLIFCPHSARARNIEIAGDIAGLGAPDPAFLKKITGMLGIAERLEHRPNETLRRRAAASRAGPRSYQPPAIVLADEPTGNLDSKSSNIVLDMLRQSNQNLGRPC